MGRLPRLLLLSGQVCKHVEQSFYGEKECDSLKCQGGVKNKTPRSWGGAFEPGAREE